MFDLVNKTLNVTVDLNGAVRLQRGVVLRVDAEHDGRGKANDWYCDANGVGGMWCSELDFIEANEQSPHDGAPVLRPRPRQLRPRRLRRQVWQRRRRLRPGARVEPGRHDEAFVASLTIAGGSGRPRVAAERFAARSRGAPRRRGAGRGGGGGGRQPLGEHDAVPGRPRRRAAARHPRDGRRAQRRDGAHLRTGTAATSKTWTGSTRRRPQRRERRAELSDTSFSAISPSADSRAEYV